MVSNSAKLDRRTKQHTESGVSTSDGSRGKARTRSWWKKKEKKRKKKKTNSWNPIKHPLWGSLIIMRQVLGCPVCDRGVIPRRRKTLRRTKSWRKKKNTEANLIVSNSAKLHRRTKQHTQFGVSASNSSRYMARTKSWRKKINK